jgi:hypothetical protein
VDEVPDRAVTVQIHAAYAHGPGTAPGFAGQSFRDSAADVILIVVLFVFVRVAGIALDIGGPGVVLETGRDFTGRAEQGRKEYEEEKA